MLKSKEERDKLVRDNLNLVPYCINTRFSNTPEFTSEWDDLYQEGCIGLIKAAERFDETKSSFSTYALSYITGYIQMYYRSRSSRFHGMKLSRKIIDAQTDIMKMQYEVADVNLADVAEKNGISLHELEYLHSGFVSLNQEANDESSKSTEVSDFIEDVTAREAFNCVTENLQLEFLVTKMQERLTKRERSVLLAMVEYYQEYGERITQTALADKLDVSRSNVSHAVKHIYEKTSYLLKRENWRYAE